MRQIQGGAANAYTLKNIGQGQATYATDFVSTYVVYLFKYLTFRDQDTDTENFVYTGVIDQHPYYIESSDNNNNYVVRSTTDNHSWRILILCLSRQDIRPLRSCKGIDWPIRSTCEFFATNRYAQR